MAGRGFGKTRVGAEQTRAWARTSRYVNLIGPTLDDARDIMIEGESGILAVCPPRERPRYIGRQLLWPNGCKSLIFTADEPERLRGKQHEKLWADELGAWRYAQDAWDQAQFGLRLGESPQAIITTTPRPTTVIKQLLADKSCVVTRGTSYENEANLAAAFYASVVRRYEGTRLGRQELNAELLDDNPAALWNRKRIDALRVNAAPVLKRVVVGLDPAVTAHEYSAETGIVAAGIGVDDHFYVLDDKSLIQSPDAWARAAVKCYHDRAADRIIGETNNGGDMIEVLLRNVDPNVSYKSVTATRGKMIRAEPVAALYEQGRVHHVGYFSQLEDQLCDYDPISSPRSPDRLDALVWALTELSDRSGFAIIDYYAQQAKLAQVAPAPQAPTVQRTDVGLHFPQR
jgi:phage terminase large subunit-like protein